MQVEIWSDVVCPWCYLGKHRFERALAGFEHAGQVHVRYRSFELDESFPADRAEPVTEVLAAKYRMTAAQAAEAEAAMAARAAAEGLAYTADRAMGRTFDAHRLVHLAAEQDLAGPMLTSLYAAYFGAGRPVFTAADLTRVAAGTGLDPARAEQVLAGDEYGDAVRADEAEARGLGISGVPFAVIDRRYGVSGAQSAEVFTRALDTAWSRGGEPAAS
jgi:predicted DsbA family dithiol-disulfide isomerase